MDHQRSLEYQVLLVRGLLALNGGVWLALALGSWLGGPGGAAGAVFTGLMLVNAAGMAGAALGLGRPRRAVYLFALMLLGANILLTITDEFGLADLLTLLLDMLLLLWLVRLRGWWLG